MHFCIPRRLYHRHHYLTLNIFSTYKDLVPMSTSHSCTVLTVPDTKDGVIHVMPAFGFSLPFSMSPMLIHAVIAWITVLLLFRTKLIKTVRLECVVYLFIHRCLRYFHFWLAATWLWTLNYKTQIQVSLGIDTDFQRSLV